MLKFKNKPIYPEEISRTIIENKDWLQEIKKLLPELDFSKRWELIGIILPELGKTAARDMVRLLFGESTALVAEKTEDYRQRMLAIECLGYLPSRETVEKLMELLSNKDDEVQISAAGALKNHTPRLVVPSLTKALFEDTVIPARAGEVLLAMGYLAEEALLERYPEAAPGKKAQILEILTLAQNPKCREFVLEGLKSEYPTLRNKALEAVAAFSFEDCWPQVVDSLLDPAWAVRVKTLQILEKLGLPETREYIELLLDDDDAWVRQCARDCLQAVSRITV